MHTKKFFESIRTSFSQFLESRYSGHLGLVFLVYSAASAAGTAGLIPEFAEITRATGAMGVGLVTGTIDKIIQKLAGE
jgi:hypothetical protein